MNAVVDLSNVCHIGGEASWDHYLAVREAWARFGGGRIHAIGDASIRMQLIGTDLAELEAAQRRGEVELVPFADPHLIRRALASEDTWIISNDRFRDHQGRFPELAGFDRLLRISLGYDGVVSLIEEPLSEVPSAERSRLAERDLVRGLGYELPEDLELLRWDWRCESPGCQYQVNPQLDVLPRCDGGLAVCPSCDDELVRLGYADGGVELKLSVRGTVLERLALADGSQIVLSRGGIPGSFDVGHLLEPEVRELVSREHLLVENRGGRLRVRDLGSTNGSTMTDETGEARTMPQGSILMMRADAVCTLAGILELRQSGRRWPRGASLLQGSSAPIAAPETTLRG